MEGSGGAFGSLSLGVAGRPASGPDRDGVGFGAEVFFGVEETLGAAKASAAAGARRRSCVSSFATISCASELPSR
jgi:hypothetical protein